MRTATFSLAALIVFTASPGLTQESPDRLRDLERQRSAAENREKELAERAERLAREAEAASRKAVAIATEIQNHERAISELEETIATIARERDARAKGLEDGRARLEQLLAALQRIARHPPEALMAYTHTPQDALRGAMLLRAAIPKLEAEANKLKEELQTLARLSEQAAARRAAVAQEREGLDAKRKELAALAGRQRELALNTRAEQKKAEARVRALAREAGDLRELLAKIERERERVAREQARERERLERERSQRAAAVTPPRRPDAPAAQAAALPAAPRLRPPPVQGNLPQRISRARGRLATPVIGTLATSFGDRDGAGTAKGMHLATRAGAQVVAPFDGEVVFSGGFRGYGPLLIIDHGEGYHSLLAGLGRLDAVVGQRVLAGEPVGVMTPAPNGAPRLYLELRQGGRPIDPLPWLATPPNSKVSG